jgi:transcriptional regulator with PAS, ATPase and Fis domain
VNVEQLFAEIKLYPDVGVAILDDQLRFRTVNPALAQMNGVAQSQHLGKTLDDVLGDFACQVSPLVRQVFVSGNPLLHCDLCGTLPTRREKGYWVGHYVPLKYCAGRVAELGAVVLEVTQQRRVERLLASFTGNTRMEVDRSLEAVERDYIVHILRKVNGRLGGPSGAAATLRMKRTTLQSRLYKLGINPRDYNVRRERS